MSQPHNKIKLLVAAVVFVLGYLSGSKERRQQFEALKEFIHQEVSVNLINVPHQLMSNNSATTLPGTKNNTKDDSLSSISTVTTTTTTTAQFIPINSNATLANDIESILHFSSETLFEVQLRPSATRCPRPYLMGRLSGPALIMVDWEWKPQEEEEEEEEGARVLVGHYSVPLPGKYFIEIIAIHCDDFLRGIPEHDKRSDGENVPTTADNSIPQEWTYNFKDVCVEDPWRHRITEDGISIAVDHRQVKSPESILPLGFWRHQKNIEEDPHVTSPSKPIYTRFQPQNCRSQDAPSYCAEPTNLDWYQDYYLDRRFSSIQNLSVQSLWQKEPVSMCFVGFSHSRRMVQAMQRLAISNTQQTNITVSWGKAKYPEDVTVEFAKGLMETYNCQKIVIGVGQWPASYDRRRPTLVDEYYREVKGMLERLRVILSSEVQIFARSIHRSAFGDFITGCPPQDWRTPPVMDAYNAAIAKACHDMGGSEKNVSFIDTTPMLAPIWDTAIDWNHLNDNAAAEEALFITAVALGIVEPADRESSITTTNASR